MTEWIVLILVSVSVVVVLYLWRQRRALAPVAYNKIKPGADVEWLELNDVTPFNPASHLLNQQSLDWQSEMALCGKQMQRRDVVAVRFVHGTFVGNDPLGLVHAIDDTWPNFPPKIRTKILSFMKTQTNRMLGDLGNFLPDYIELFSKAIGPPTNCSVFHWSSANHHYARLKGALDLATHLASDADINPAGLKNKTRILLIGHSHAGQVFALLTQLLNSSGQRRALLALSENLGFERKTLEGHLDFLHTVFIDMVTFGAPILYQYKLAGRFRLLHIVNHRGATGQAGSLRGILHTRDGDYIQQLGIRGTDILGLSPIQRSVNAALDDILGSGLERKAWWELARLKLRVPPDGKTVLVDYRDDGKLLPNGFQTMFGHGIYTKFDMMLFNTQLIVDQFY